jgi:hypothetical protein
MQAFVFAEVWEVAKLRERISVSKQARQKLDLERFDLKKLDDKDVKEKYQVEI